ncbi:hypothetical protein [Pseudomonas baltica]|uniref:Uncharacterized protein n=1 Tax=Pseudomonas baltica TaxID=2762576 RepID=A0A7X1KUT5_9PSED|nr:hypothetical protein [Pseudomonas baltica]MBC2680159.1 hypothetical protein [Pseudomonas baltica]
MFVAMQGVEAWRDGPHWDTGFSRGIKKPAYGRLLVDDLALLLVSRNRLQLMTSLGW